MKQLVSAFIIWLITGPHISFAQQNSSFNDSLYVIEQDVKITMKDGIRLNAYSVRFKEDTVPVPVMLMISCYPMTDDWRSMQYYLRRGMAAVLVYCRGKEKSEGIFEPFENEAEDNYEVIDWISKQRWCNGSIGMYGGSYLGFTQWASLKKMHPALKTIVPLVAVAPGIDYPMHNNVFMSYMLRWINYTTNNKMRDVANFANEKYWSTLFRENFEKGNSFTHLDSMDGERDKIFQRWLAHPDYDSFWTSMIPYTPEEYARINIPILTVTGYFDADQRGAMYYYERHNKYAPKEAVDNHYLLIGPWDHLGAQTYPQRKIGSFKVDNAALVPVLPIVMDWFDHVLRGKARPAMLKDRVNYFVIGGEWKHKPSLAAMNTDTLQYFLQGGMDNWHHLTNDEKKAKGSVSLGFDFQNKAPGYSVEEIDILEGAFMTGHDQFIFDSKPLEQDIELNGTPVADLFMNINKRDIDLYLSFYEVTPDGKSFQLSKTVQRLSYLSSREKRKLVEPGKLNRYVFTNSYFISKKIKKGSVIRFVVKPLNSPSWQKNYGTGRLVSQENGSDASPLVMQIFTGKKYKSSIYIPYVNAPN
jgi:putative CocE/NonD family hydrolase